MKIDMDMAAFKAAVLKYADSENVNPFDGGRGHCVYVLNGKHCLIGQVLSDAGVKDYQLRRWDGEDATDPYSIFEDEGVGWLANRLQVLADGGIAGPPRPWKDVIAEVEWDV